MRPPWTDIRMKLDQTRFFVDRLEALRGPAAGVMLARMRQLRAPLQAACGFGLSAEEVWETLLEVAAQLHPVTPVSQCREKVIEALAQRIETRSREEA
jgi:hypothetical protein